MRRASSRAFLLSASLLCAHASIGQNGWTIQHFTSNNGLPQNSVVSMAMDSLQYLWLTTEAGLVRYNGMDFRGIRPKGSEEPTTERMRAIVRTFSEDLAVTDATSNIFLIHAHHLAFKVLASDGILEKFTGTVPSVELYARAADRLQTLPGRSEWKGQERTMQATSEQDWSISGAQAILFYKDSALTGRIPVPAHTACSWGFGRGWVTIDSAGQAAVLSEGGASFVPVGSIPAWPATITASDGLTHRFFQHGGDNTLVYQRGAEFYIIRSSNAGGGFALEHLDIVPPERCKITDALWDTRNAVLMLGTDTRGLFIYRKSFFRSVHASDPRPGANNVYYAVLPFGADRLLAMTSLRAVMEVRGGMATPLLQYPDGMNPSCAISGPDSTILLADRKHVRQFDPRTGLVDSMVTADVEVSCMTMLGDTLWLGTYKSLGYALHGTYYPMVNTAAGHVDDHAYFIRRGPDGRIWFGTTSGAFTLEPRSGKSSEFIELKGRCVRAMETIDGLVFIGTYGDGAFVIRGKEVIHLPLDPEGRMKHIHAFVTDRSGNIWMSTNRGLFRMGRQDVIRWWKDRTTTPTYEYFGAYAGIDNVEFNGGCDPAYARLDNGTLSLPTMDGVVQFMPDEVPPIRPNTTVILEHASVDGVPTTDGFLHFSPDARTIRVPFSCSYWGDPQNLRLQYTLAESGNAWTDIPAGAQEVVVGNLPPGTYAFHIRSSEEGSAETGLTMYFTVDGHWYASFWFFLLMAGVAVGLFALGQRMVSNRLERRNAVLEEAVHERTLQLSDINSELARSLKVKENLVRIVTHDIVTPLRFIAQVARNASGRSAGIRTRMGSDAMEDISNASTKLYRNAQNLLDWVKLQEHGMELRPVNVVMNLQVEEAFGSVREIAASKGLVLVNAVSLDDTLLIDQDVLAIVLNNLVINAVTHTEQGSVAVEGAVMGKDYILYVRDTGSGFSKAALTHLQRLGDYSGTPDIEQAAERPQGLGYVIVSELLALLGGSFVVQSEPGRGTSVILTLRRR